MATQEAICRIRLKQPPSDSEPEQVAALQVHELTLTTSPNKNDTNTAVIEPSDTSALLPIRNIASATPEVRLKWANAITDLFFKRDKSNSQGTSIRDWDLLLSADGSVENRAVHIPAATVMSLFGKKNSSDDKKEEEEYVPLVYPAPYRVPDEILARLRSKEQKLQRSEMFALGGLLYWVFSGEEMWKDEGGREGIETIIKERLVKGEFPDDVWGLKYAVRILGCWCPGFAKSMLVEHGKNTNVLQKFSTYVKSNPILFSMQVAGVTLSLASIVALPILGAIGFGAAGPIAGSAAAGWQASIGLVEAGSFFAWCQSVAMGGAAVGGVVGAGLAGVGVAVGAVAVGALDEVMLGKTGLKEEFLEHWKEDLSEEDGGEKDRGGRAKP